MYSYAHAYAHSVNCAVTVAAEWRMHWRMHRKIKKPDEFNPPCACLPAPTRHQIVWVWHNDDVVGEWLCVRPLTTSNYTAQMSDFCVCIYWRQSGNNNRVENTLAYCQCGGWPISAFIGQHWRYRTAGQSAQRMPAKVSKRIRWRYKRKNSIPINSNISLSNWTILN